MTDTSTHTPTSRKQRTPEEACIAYAKAVDEVRSQTRIIRANRCTVADRPSERSYTEGSMTPCRGDVGIDHDEWCDACKTASDAVRTRQSARKRLVAAKRAVEAIGKRLSK